MLGQWFSNFLALCTFLQSHFNVWLNRRHLDSYICLCVQFVAVFVFRKYWQMNKICLTDIEGGKGKGITKAFSNNHRYSSLVLYQYLAAGSFLKFRWSVETETILYSFSIAPSTNCHKRSSWQQNLLSHSCRGPKSGIKVPVGWPSFYGSWRDSVLASLIPWWLLVFPDLWSHHCNLYLCSHIALSSLLLFSH